MTTPKPQPLFQVPEKVMRCPECKRRYVQTKRRICPHCGSQLEPWQEKARYDPATADIPF